MAVSPQLPVGGVRPGEHTDWRQQRAALTPGEAPLAPASPGVAFTWRDVLMCSCQGWGQHPYGHELDSARTTLGVKLDEWRLNGPCPLPSPGLLLKEHLTPGGDSVCGPRARRGSEEAASPLLTDLLRGWQTAAQGGFGHTAWTLSKTSFSWCHVHAARHVWECVGASGMALMSPGGTGPSDWNLPRVWLCPGPEMGALRWGP